jgi:epoxyqueuosine reductase
LHLETFFSHEGIDVFAEIGISDLSGPDRESVVHFFPKAGSVIIFGREVPAPAYLMPPRQKTKAMLRIAEDLDESASRLADLLNADRVPAVPVPLYLPVRIEEGRVQGMVRLKNIAVAGQLGIPGANSVLFHPRYGPRLLLAGVVTGRQVQPNVLVNGEKPGALDAKGFQCIGCGRCVKVCPEGAVQPDHVDAFRCRTVRAWIPPPLVPAVKFLLGRTLLLKAMAPLAPWIARTATIRCSLCVTECPKFSVDEKPGKHPGDADTTTEKPT